MSAYYVVVTRLIAAKAVWPSVHAVIWSGRHLMTREIVTCYLLQRPRTPDNQTRQTDRQCDVLGGGSTMRRCRGQVSMDEVIRALHSGSDQLITSLAIIKRRNFLLNTIIRIIIKKIIITQRFRLTIQRGCVQTPKLHQTDSYICNQQKKKHPPSVSRHGPSAKKKQQKKKKYKGK